ncbi:hypothetical protein IJG78_01805 [Candidatus Saccharibacteria bacterium]|nr:hypothetical protein [Candidatus Saccharibacteria bacterium]MBQ3469835.1 hypothetical protein [Candidatus Saccharibacteria bacterium]
MAEENAKKTNSKKTDKKVNKGLIAGIIAAVVAVIAIVVTVILINAAPKVVGKYNLVAFVDSDGNESTSMVDFIKAFGGNYTIEFKNDRTGVLEVSVDSSLFSSDDSTSSSDSSNNSVKFTYTDKKVKFDKDGQTEEADYEYKDGTVKLNYDGQGMKFEKEKK